MATKLYPPQLEGALPAFYKSYDEDNNLIGCTINIPFGVNRAVNIQTVDKIALRLRTTSTNTYLIADSFSTNFYADTCVASFKFDYDSESEDTNQVATLINEGQYYRAQIAFVQDDIIGYYSTVGIIKCVAKPSVYIGDYAVDKINAFDDSFKGVYQQNTQYGDSTEKAYSYKFELFDMFDNLVLTTDEQVHDVTQDTYSDTSYDIWEVGQEFPEDEIYKLRYTVTTINGLVISTVDYRVSKALSVKSEYDLKLHADANYNDGYIDIYLEGYNRKNNGIETFDFELDPDLTTNFVYRLVNDTMDYDETFNYYIDMFNNYVLYTPIEEMTDEEKLDKWLELRDSQQLYIKEFSTIIGEQVCSGNFIITRSCSKDNYQQWVEITRFTLTSEYPSKYHFQDYTVEQGIEYKYAVQQFNIHNIKSRKTYQTDKYGNENVTMADFEDMFLSDGIRHLKVRFNPKVTSFKNTIPEQKIETIGSKYPFIFRNGSVCYKEFPIGGLISFQMDDAMTFLNEEELKQAGILEYGYCRAYTNIDRYNHIDKYDSTLYKLQTLKIPIYMKDRYGSPHLLGYRQVITEYNNKKAKITTKNSSKKYTHYLSDGVTTKEPSVIRQDRNLTSENILGERYFKLKVLDWLTNGEVKLFRSATEGNYLVRLLNVSLTPQDPLGRMLHQFTSTAYEIDELNYQNLVAFGIVIPEIQSNFESQWASVDINTILKESDTSDFIKVSVDGIVIDGVDIQDFAPGDQIKLVYDSGPDGIFTIGVTGNLNLNNDDRTIIEVYIKPNPEMNNYNDFSRVFYYRTTNLQMTKFDAIMDFKNETQIAEQFIGPAENLLEPFILRDNVYGVKNEQGVVLEPLSEITAYENVHTDLKAHKRLTYKINEDTDKFTGLKIDILHVSKKEVIPIFCYSKGVPIQESKFGVTPFGIPYVNYTNILNFVNPTLKRIRYVDNVLTMDDNGEYIRANGVNIEDITTVFDENGVIYNLYDLLEPYFYDEDTKEWKSFKDFENNSNLPGYYDLYRHEWMSSNFIYDPTFSINTHREFADKDERGDIILEPEMTGDHNISLLGLNEITLHNLGSLSTLRLGNGVVAEVTAQIQVVDYEIEETDIATKTWKEAYLNSKKQLEDSINIAMLHLDDLRGAEAENTKLIQEISDINDQIEAYQQGTNASTGIMKIAKTRLIAQKKKLWYTLRQQLNDILTILTQQNIYLNINSGSEETIPALISYDYNTGLAKNQIFEENRAYIIEGEDEEIHERNRTLLNDRYLWLYNNPSEDVTINLGELTKTYQIVSDAYLFYKPQYENAQANAQTIIDKCNEQLESLMIQRGNLLGGYLSDYDDENPPPEGTYIYIQYQIAQIDKQLQEALDHCIEIKSNYIAELLQIILLQLNRENDLTTVTDTYIIDTATELVALLDHYINIKENTDQPAIEGASYSTETITSQLETLRMQRDLLQAIVDDGWRDDRAADNLITPLPDTASNEWNTFITKIQEIRSTYINDASSSINSKLEGTGKTINDILNITSSSTQEEKLVAILNILVDQYNKSPATSVQQYLKQYYNTDTKNLEIRKQELLSAISNAEATYQTEKKQLTTSKNAYNVEGEKYSAQLNELQRTTEAIEQTRSNAKADYDKAAEALRIGRLTEACQDSIELIESIARTPEHQNNVSLALGYMNWLVKTQDNLLNQIGQVFANLETEKDYADMLLSYINAYEIEAFQFLHQYDALEVDLEQGFLGTDGIDWLYYQPYNYWLSSYKDILYLKNGELTEERNIDENTTLTWIQCLENSDENIRLDTYVALKENLENILFDKINEPAIKLSILGTKIFDVSENKNILVYRLVKLKDSGDPCYPNVYELNDIDYENPIDLIASKFLIPDHLSYSRSTYDFRNAVETEREIDGISVRNYYKDPHATMYYTADSTFDNLIKVFDTSMDLVSDEDFATVAREAEARRQPIKWLPNLPPVVIDINFHQSLYNTYSYETDFQNVLENPEALLIKPDYYQHFQKALGLLVHDYQDGQEYGSWMALKEIDASIWVMVADYLTTWSQYDSLSVETNIDLVTYNRLKALSLDMQLKINEYDSIVRECEIVLKSYDAEQIDPNSSKYQQLLILRDSAQEEKLYYIEQKAMYDEQLKTLENNNSELKEYNLYMESIPDIKKKIKLLIAEYNREYEIYSKRAKHYLYLLFNDEPYGHEVDRTVLQNQDILSINGNNTNMYNFGIAYALESYKKNKDSEDPINFTEVIDSVNTFSSILDENYDFVFPIQKYEMVAEGVGYDGTYDYYQQIAENIYVPYEYVDADTWTTDVNNHIVFVIHSYEPYDNANKTYYTIKDGEFVQYRFIDDKQWEIDRDTLDIYYTIYPSLIEFATQDSYRLVVETDKYSSIVQYYEYIDEHYIPRSTTTAEEWADGVANGSIYVKVGNGGIRGFLKNLVNNSTYINGIKENYIGTLSLYESLYAQSLGDTTSLNNLKTILAKDLARQKELEEILQYKDVESLDIDKLVNEIYDNLTYYLISLTNAYINLVERSYAVI